MYRVISEAPNRLEIALDRNHSVASTVIGLAICGVAYVSQAYVYLLIAVPFLVAQVVGRRLLIDRGVSITFQYRVLGLPLWSRSYSLKQSKGLIIEPFKHLPIRFSVGSGGPMPSMTNRRAYRVVLEHENGRRQRIWTNSHGPAVRQFKSFIRPYLLGRPKRNAA